MVNAPYTQTMRYNAEEFHFHHPGEHTFDGQPYPLEMHIVHKLDSSYSSEETHCVAAIHFKISEKPSAFLENLNLKDLSPIKQLNIGQICQKTTS